MVKKYQTKKWAAILLTVLMMVTSTPFSAMAAAAESSNIEPVLCTVTEGCMLEENHEGECAAGSVDSVEGDLDQPENAQEEQAVAVKPAMKNRIDAPALLAENNLSGSCGATESDNITWALTQNNEDDENPTYTLTISGSGAMADYKTASDVPWNTYNKQITDGIVENGITHLGARTFVLTENLSSVTLADSLISIGESAFNQSKLSSITFPQNLKTIGKNAFWHGNLTGELIIPESVQTIEDFAFDQNNLTKVTLPAGLEILGSGALKANPLTSMPDIPSQITSLTSTFQNCTELTTIEIPSHVTVLDRTFMGCTSLTSVTIPETVESYVGAFNSCTGLTTAVIESKATDIGGENTNDAYGVFGGCNNLQTVTVPEWVTVIGQAAFRGCSSLSTTDFIERAEVIEKNAFQYCTNLKGSLNLSATTIKTNAFDGCSGLGANISVANATTIESNAFRNCSSITGIVYAQQVSGGANAFTSRTNTALLNGGKFNAQTDISQNHLSSPVKGDCIFEGWYDNMQFTGDKVTKPVTGKTYYAKWTGMEDVELQFGGTQKITISGGITLSGYTSSNTSVATVDNSGNVTATGVGTATLSATGAYNGKQTTFTATVTVTPRVLTYYNKDTNPQENPGSVTYPVSADHTDLGDVLTFKWKDAPNTEVTLNYGSDIDYTYTVPAENGGSGVEVTVDFLPMPAGNYSVQFNLKNPNYVFSSSSAGGGTLTSITVTANVTAAGVDRAYLAGINSTGTTFSYDGEGKFPAAGLLAAYKEDSTSSERVDIGGFTVHIEGLNDTTFHSAAEDVAAGTDISAIEGLDLPILPGAYVATVSAANDDYYIYKSQVFTITRGTVTIRPDDKTAYVGDAVPVLGENDYTVTGLAGGDALETAPTLSYESEPDMSVTGTYSIIASGAAVNNELYTLSYEPGVLTVTDAVGPEDEKPQDTDDPEDEKPQDTDDPDDSVSPSGNGDEPGQSAGDTKDEPEETVPGTGDNTNPGLWVALALAGAAGAGYAVISRRRR